MVPANRLKGLKKLTTRTIARDLIIGLVTVVTLVAGGFIGLNYLIISRQNISQFQQKSEEFITYLQGSLAAPIWNFDDETITQIAQSILKNELIAGLRVSDYKNSPMFEGANPTQTGAVLTSKSFDIRYRDKLAGYVDLTFSAHLIEERNRQLLASSLLTLGVILLALISVTGILLKVLVGKPVDHVLQTISRIAQGDYHLRADLPPQAEIAQIITQFNSMAEQIQLRENALTDTNMRFEAILDNSTAVFYLKDVQGRYILVNERYEELFHVDRKTIVGSTDYDVFPHDLADVFFRNDQKVLTANAPIEFEEIAPHDDGPHTYLSVKFPLKDSQGHVYAICGISTDITRRKVAEQEVRKLNQDLELRVERRTMALNRSNEQLKAEMEERRRAETALRNNEALLLSTLESTIDGVLVIQNNEVTHTNQRFWQMWNFPRDTADNMPIDAIRSHMKDLLEQPEDFLERANLLYQSQKDSLDILSLRDGRVFERFSCPLIIENQNQGRVWCFRDISDKKQAEEAMARSKDAAEAANRAKSEFLASMSHEIRTPMNGVMGMSSLLLETKLNKEQREYANTIQTSAESLLTIINDILDFSKIEAGKLDIEAVNFDLLVAVEEVTEMLALGAHQKGLALGSLIHANVPQFLIGDPGRLRQIIVNLTSNAIKFTEKGHVAIHVDLDSETEAHATLRFSIIDTGIGIPTDRQDRLFKSFSQVDASTTRKFGGTGLGLAISKKLAELLGGQIGVESNDGQGSTFWFTAELQKQSNLEAMEPPSSPSIAGKRILAVDDNPVNLEIMRAYLKSWGCQFAVAGSGQSALDMLHSAARSGQAFDMAIIDYMMPEMDGESLAVAIKTAPMLKGIKMVKLSSSGLRGDFARSMEMGFAAALTKPIKRRELFDRLAEVFGVGGEKSLMAKNHQDGTTGLEKIRQRNIRVLIVEDNATNQKVAQHMLKIMGCHTDVAGNGAEAIQAFKQIPYDFILMDVQMPVMDGLTAAKKIRELEAATHKGTSGLRSHTPIVALTANVMKGDREKCLASGMDDFLAKPINPNDVRQKIHQWVINTSADNASPVSKSGLPMAGISQDDQSSSV